MKIAYIDTETTGLDAQRNGVVQLAAILERDGEVVDRINLDIAPMPGDIVESEALAVSGKTSAEVYQYPSASDAYRTLSRALTAHVSKFDKYDKFFFLAYNAPFDSGFVRRFFEKNGDKYYGSYFWHPPICVMNMAAQKLAHRRADLPNFKLTTVAEAIGVACEGNAHDATYDITLTREVYKKLLEEGAR